MWSGMNNTEGWEERLPEPIAGLCWLGPCLIIRVRVKTTLNSKYIADGKLGCIDVNVIVAAIGRIVRFEQIRIKL